MAVMVLITSVMCYKHFTEVKMSVSVFKKILFLFHSFYSLWILGIFLKAIFYYTQEGGIPR